MSGANNDHRQWCPTPIVCQRNRTRARRLKTGWHVGVRFRIDNDAGFAPGRYVGNAVVERFIDQNMAVKKKRQMTKNALNPVAGLRDFLFVYYQFSRPIEPLANP